MSVFAFFAGAVVIALVLVILIEIFGPTGLLSKAQNIHSPAAAAVAGSGPNAAR